ncbi:DNA ligase 4 isoform X2 [Lasioglossum baleicum]|uniref:DNA ligase 4 isoform X2 n=1 Tax=Lasioglossum baleicum TaxID=434251 RepID=UPI003FCCB4D7
MSATLEEKIKFKDLCNVLEKVTKTPVAKKTDILEKFIQECRRVGCELRTQDPNADVSPFPIFRLILPHLERIRGPSNLKEKSLANLYIRVFCLGKSSKDAKTLLEYKVPRTGKVGRDFAEIAYRTLQNRLKREASGLTIQQINAFLDNISNNEILKQKDETFKILLGKINALEFKWITRIILKDLKLGTRGKKILEVIHPDANSVIDVSNLHYVCDTLFYTRLRYHHDIEVFSHFKPMLLEKCKIEDTKKLFLKGEQYFVQYKYDGERSQIHMKDGRYKYFTRQGYEITNNPGYGETSSSGFMSSVFSRLLNPNCKSIILDGELMGWHKEKKLLGSKAMNFDVKKLSDSSHHQPCFIAFDIIMYNDTLLNNETYEKRLETLKSAFNEEEGSLMLCEINKISKSESLCQLFNESMKNKEEGLVVKRCDIKYKPNVRDGSGCYKIKAEYSDNLVTDVDLIILGGYYGEGRFMNLIKSFLVGVATPPDVPGENPTKFLSVVSVSNGFSMDTLRDLWNKFDGKWKNECPANVIPPRLDKPGLWMSPEDSIIITVRASEMTRSNDYPTGYSLRFPRVTSVRTDKPWYNVCTTVELLSIVKDSRYVQKLTKRDVDHDDIEEHIEVKVRRTSKQRLRTYDNKPTMINIYESTPVCLTRLFDGKEICVINGDDELAKERIEEILVQHRAKVVQNPLNENYCVIVGNVKTARAKDIIQKKIYDVVTLDWFKRVIKEENWYSLRDFLPWDLISCRESTKRRLAENYDDYYDNFLVNATEESLTRSLEKAEEEAKIMELDLVQMNELDKELFDHGISPYSIFRNIVGYFNNLSDSSKYVFRFLSGTVKETLDDSVTHIFIDESPVSSELKSSLNDELQRRAIIVKSEWIEACFNERKLIPDEEYLSSITLV